MSGRADSRDVSAIRALAARESRHEERTASLSHHIMRDDMTVVLVSANRRLTELANPALRLTMWPSDRVHPHRRSFDGRLRGPRTWAGGLLGGGSFEGGC